MRSIAYSVATLTDEEAEQVAAAYIKADKDPLRMARLLGVDSLDLNVVMHPLTRGYIVRMHRELQTTTTLHEHIDMLKKIRDAALDDDNLKIALASETQIGKAAGLYDPKPMVDPANDPSKPMDPTKLSTDDLRRRIAHSIGAVVVQPESAQSHALPEPSGDLEAMEEDEDNTV